jgi:prepilin-type N-terminal cleavage/methylation domain-containing protein
MMLLKHRSNPCPRDRRRAFSLVEMLVVTALATVLMGVAISFVQGMMRCDRLTRDRGLHDERLFDLAEQLRADIRHAKDVQLSACDTLVVSSSQGEQATYELAKEGCRRVVAVGGQQSQIELFAIDGSETWSIQQSASGAAPLVLVTLDRAASDDSQIQLAPLLVQAQLGADLPELKKGAATSQADANSAGSR